MIAEPRLIDTYFISKVPVENLRIHVFVNDAHMII